MVFKNQPTPQIAQTPSWKHWKKRVRRTRQLCTSFIKLWTSSALRRLQMPNLKKAWESERVKYVW